MTPVEWLERKFDEQYKPCEYIETMEYAPWEQIRVYSVLNLTQRRARRMISLKPDDDWEEGHESCIHCQTNWENEIEPVANWENEIETIGHFLPAL